MSKISSEKKDRAPLSAWLWVEPDGTTHQVPPGEATGLSGCFSWKNRGKQRNISSDSILVMVFNGRAHVLYQRRGMSHWSPEQEEARQKLEGEKRPI